MTDYPPQPWRLAGQADLSLWRVPARALPRVPRGIRPITVAGQALVGTAWIDYQPPGRLRYHELLCAVAVHNGGRPAVCVTEIWVDSKVSLAGGRELWAIPKEMATLDFGPTGDFTATDQNTGDWIATARFVRRAAAPARLPTAFQVAQSTGTGVRRSPVASTARPVAARAAWRINPAGPLGYLAGRKPVGSAALADFDMTFGSAE